MNNVWSPAWGQAAVLLVRRDKVAVAIAGVILAAPVFVGITPDSAGKKLLCASGVAFIVAGMKLVKNTQTIYLDRMIRLHAATSHLRND